MSARIPSSSLSRRLLWLTIGVVLLIEILFFVPAISDARRQWLTERVASGQLAAMAVLDSPADRATTEDLLRLARAESVRLLLPGRGPVTLGLLGQAQASHVVDLGREDAGTALAQALGALLDGRDRLVLVQALGPVRPGTLVSVVVHERDLTLHLRRRALSVALLALIVASSAGLFVNFALNILLVRPMRRLTDSIAAFRADPERTPPLETAHLTPLAGDEVAVAGRELADMQRELRAALWRNARLAALGTAVAKVSHDLRGLLAPALLSAERLQMHSDPSVSRGGDVLVRAVERATELVRGGLEFAREGPVTLTRTRFALHEAVAEAADQVRATLPATTIENTTDPAIELDADREHVDRVLANLLRNAAEAGARHVTVAAQSGPTGTTVTIADDGPGLPERVLASLFKPFVVGARKGSTGLGLAIARDLMRAHLGDVVLVHSGPEGSTFCLQLPPTLSRLPARAAEPRVAASTT